MPRALFAALVLAIATDVVGSVESLAMMARPLNSHSNFLLDPLGVSCHRSSPLFRAYSEAIFSEQYPSFLFLYCAGLCSCLRESCVVGPKVSNGLSDSSRDGKCRCRCFTFGDWFSSLNGRPAVKDQYFMAHWSIVHCAYMDSCSGIASAGALVVSSEGCSSVLEIEPLLEPPLLTNLLALLMRRESTGGLSPEPPEPPGAGELIMYGDLKLNCVGRDESMCCRKQRYRHRAMRLGARVGGYTGSVTRGESLYAGSVIKNCRYQRLEVRC